MTFRQQSITWALLLVVSCGERPLTSYTRLLLTVQLLLHWWHWYLDYTILSIHFCTYEMKTLFTVCVWPLCYWWNLYESGPTRRLYESGPTNTSEGYNHWTAGASNWFSSLPGNDLSLSLRTIFWATAAQCTTYCNSAVLSVGVAVYSNHPCPHLHACPRHGEIMAHLISCGCTLTPSHTIMWGDGIPHLLIFDPTQGDHPQWLPDMPGVGYIFIRVNTRLAGGGGGAGGSTTDITALSCGFETWSSTMLVRTWRCWSCSIQLLLLYLQLDYRGYIQHSSFTIILLQSIHNKLLSDHNHGAHMGALVYPKNVSVWNYRL